MKKLYDCHEIQKIYSPAVTFENNELHLLKVALIATHRCTLKCKLCAERTPYYPSRYHPTFEEMKQQLIAYFSVVDYTMKLEISGGEVFVRNDLEDLFEFLLQFKKQFGRIRIITNGTLPISNGLCNILLKFGSQIDVLIDCYSSKGQLLSKNAVKNFEFLQKAGITCYLRKQSEEDLHCNGWVDFGSFSHKKSPEEAIATFKKCAIAQKIGGGMRMKNGVLSPCAITQQLADFGIHPLQPNESCNLFDSSLSVIQKKQIIFNMFSLKQLSSCSYCNGMCDDSERFAPAEQISTEDIQKYNPTLKY